MEQMKCHECGGIEQPVKVMNHFYDISGLDNVYLDNMQLYKCENCGATSESFFQMPRFHNAVAKAIVLQPWPLNNQDIKFLRKNLTMKAKEFAALLKVDPSTYSRWENGEQKIGQQMDSLIRLTYILAFEAQEQKRFSEDALGIIAAVEPDAKSGIIVFNMDNYAIYSYKQKESVAA